MSAVTSPAESEIARVARWDGQLDGEARAALERALPAYIAGRRWYRTKTKRVQSARIRAAFPVLFGASGTVARITFVELALEDGTRDTYVLPLGFVQRKEDRGGAGVVVDALELEGFAAELLAAMGRGASIEDAGATLRFHGLATLTEGAAAAAAGGRARLVSREQTNSSVLYGERWAGKVVRKLDPGESADLEMGRFLTAVGYAHTPALEGWIDVRFADDAGAASAASASTVALLHAFVPNQGDAWGHALGVLEAWLDEGVTKGAAPPPLGGGDVLARATRPLPRAATEAVGEYVELAERMGRRVGEMHVALASRPEEAAFAPEPLDAATRGVTVSAARADLARALVALGARGPQLPDAARFALSAVRGCVRSFDARLADVVELEDAGVKMRVHGDLHLGQVLFTGVDFVIIDFEGEPARTLEERKAKRSPLVDVAGMLRSFHYASVSAVRARPEAARAAAGPWAAVWHDVVAASFLRGWLSAVEGSVVVPREAAVTRALLEVFLLEKAIYEVGYEMNNRPDWVDIPLEGLRGLVVDANANANANTNANANADADADAKAKAKAKGGVGRSMIDGRSPAVAAFGQGTATHAHGLFGAHPHQEGATDFAVWAPHASGVAVLGDFNGWDAADGALLPIGATGIFAARVRGAEIGHRYKYRITPASGAEALDKTDPFGVMCEPSPGSASVIASLAYAWGDEAWMENRVQNARVDRPMSIYEVHLGSWRRGDGDGGGEGEGAGGKLLGYRDLAAPLAAHAKAMGFTHVELMPVLEHPFYGSWGYGVTGFFAATSRYGSPADLMYLVDTLHRAGLGVIFDWVPAHFARDAHGLGLFDGAPLFEPEDPARAVHPTWGSGVFDFAKPEVRSFLLSSATFWIETFHADGLRVDGVESILYLDHHAGKEDAAGVAFLRQLTSTLKREHPEVQLAAEDSSAWPGVTRAADVGGLGFDLKWDMGFSHDMRSYLGMDPIERSSHQGKLTFRAVYGPSEAFVLPLSHDDVIEERGGSLLQQMHGDAWQKLANLRLLLATTFAQTGKKLIFMGDEFAQARAWHHDRGLDWQSARETTHDSIARMVGDLNRIYRETTALHAGDASPNGFEWIDGSNAEMSVITFLRRGRADEDVVLVALNFTPVPRHQYRIGVPRGGGGSGRWREIFNSDAQDYGGSGHGNMGGVESVPYPWNGRASSVVVTLPPLGAIFLARG